MLQLNIYSLAWNMLVRGSSVFMSSRTTSIASIATVIPSGSLFVYVIFIICGIHPSYYPKQTMLASLYVAMNIIFATPMLEETNQTSPVKENHNNSALITKHMKVWYYLLGPSMNTQQNLHQASFYGSLIGMIATSILRILDHGMQIQRHPVPILIGFSWGNVVGLIFGIIWKLLR